MNEIKLTFSFNKYGEVASFFVKTASRFEDCSAKYSKYLIAKISENITQI